MDFETCSMEFEIKDEVKDEVVEEEAQEAAVNDADPELKVEEQRIDAQNLFCPSPPPTFNSDVELNPIITPDFITEDNIQNRLNNSISKARLICPHCPKSFPTRKALEKHSFNLHTAEQDKRVEFRCVTCAGRKFNDQKSRDEHIKQFHISNVSVLLSRDRSLIEFPFCTKFFEVEKNLNTHVPKEVSEPLEIDPLATAMPSVGPKMQLKILTTVRYKCPHCDETFAQNFHLKQHMQQFHCEPKPRVRCPHCPLTFLLGQKKTFRSHMKKLHNEDCHLKSKPVEKCTQEAIKPAFEALPKKCPHCDIKFFQKCDLSVHIAQMHRALSRVKCPHCSLEFVSEHTLKDHSELHGLSLGNTHQERENFVDQQSLEHHIGSCHVVDQQASQPAQESVKLLAKKCPHCSKTFSQKRLLNSHIKRLHSGPRLRIQCSQCPSSFLRNQSLEHHIKICHNKERSDTHDNETELGVKTQPRKCSPCGKKFSAVRSPKKRQRCLHCPLILSSSDALKMHVVRFHERHKAFTCLTCQSVKTSKTPVFPSQKKLNYHMQLYHDPASLKKCPRCDKGFPRSTDLKYHILSKHLNIPRKRFKNYVGNTKYTLENLLKEQKMLAKQKEPDSIIVAEKRTTKSQIGGTNNCRYCNNVFLSARKLRNHIIEIHVKQKKTGEKEPENSTKSQCQPSPRVQCPKCSSTFSNSKHLQFHIMLLHNEKGEFPCLICTSRDQGRSDPKADTEMKIQNAIFKDEKSLKQHMKIIHYSTHKQNKNLQEPENGPIVFPKNKICPICSKSFDRKYAASNYRGHMETHLGIRRYSCEHCSKKFAAKLSLHSHLIRYHNYSSKQLNFKYACQLCPFITESQLRLNHHVRVKHPNLNSNDGLQLGKEMGVETTIESNHSSRASSSKNEKNPTESAVCFVCSKFQTSRCNLVQHLKEHRGEGRFYCDLCPRDYSVKMSLMVHLKLDHHQLAYCNKCFTSFTDPVAFNQHMLHVDVPVLNSNQTREAQALEGCNSSTSDNLKCEICHDSSKSQCLFKIHTISHLKQIQQQEFNFPDDEVVSVDNIFKCGVCPSAFDRQSYLKAHLEIVHKLELENTLFKCGKCEQSYKFVNELKFHDIVVHSPKINQHINQKHSADTSKSEFGFKCDTCVTQFETLSALIHHQDKFMPEVLCHICPAKFVFKSYLENHIRKVHKGEYDTGSRSSQINLKSSGRDLQRHVNKTNEGKYKSSLNFLCHICPLKFSRDQDLRRHVDNVHEGKYKISFDFLCHICSFKFSRDQDLQRHLQRIHRGGKSTATINVNTENNSEPQSDKTISDGKNKSHQKEKKPPGKFTCKICSAVYRNKNGLLLHISNHHTDDALKPFECHICHRKYNAENLLKIHIYCFHRHVPNFRCEVCFVAIRTRIRLIQHLKNEHGRAEYCKTCKRAFETKADFDKHSNKDPPGNFPCDTCHTDYPSQCLLIKHCNQKKHSAT